MRLLEERIQTDGIVREGNVLKVDSFLNHQMDIKLFREIGKEFNKLLIITHVTELQSMLSQRMYFTKSSKGTKITVIK